MSNKTPNNALVIPLILMAIAGASVLIISPDLLSGISEIFAWTIIIIVIATALFLRHSAKKKFQQQQERLLAKRQRKRMQQLKENKAQQEERTKKNQEKAEKKEKRRKAKQLKMKEELVKEAETTWADKEKYAAEKEANAREIITKTNNMDIRTMAGSVAIEWNQAVSLAQWTAQQLLMFSRRPDVTTQARDEARNTIIEVAALKAGGHVITEKQSLELREKKKKAQEEALIEEERLDTINNIIENADLKWKVTESRANREQEALENLIKRQKNWEA